MEDKRSVRSRGVGVVNTFARRRGEQADSSLIIALSTPRKLSDLPSSQLGPAFAGAFFSLDFPVLAQSDEDSGDGYFEVLFCPSCS